MLKVINFFIVPAIIAVPDIDPGTSLEIATIDVSCNDLGHLMCNRSIIVTNSECSHIMDVGLSCADHEANNEPGYIIVTQLGPLGICFNFKKIFNLLWKCWGRGLSYNPNFYLIHLINIGLH